LFGKGRANPNPSRSLTLSLSASLTLSLSQDLEEAHFSEQTGPIEGEEEGGKITELCLGPHPFLKKLCLQSNQIASMGALSQKCTALEHLDLTGNAVESLDELAHIAHLSQLKVLSLAENPITGQDKYRNFVHAILPQLETLDGEPYAEEDMEPPPEPEPEAPEE